MQKESIIILCDTREQNPLEFNQEGIKELRKHKLDVGDYGAILPDGFIPPICFERKELGDLFGSLAKNYKRFKREIERAKKKGITLILIIEGTLNEVNIGHDYSTVEGKSILKTIFSLWVRYDVVPVFCNSRSEMSDYIVHYYSAYKRKYFSKEKRT